MTAQQNENEEAKATKNIDENLAKKVDTNATNRGGNSINDDKPKKSKTFCFLLLLVAIACVLIFGFAYVRLAKVNVQLAQNFAYLNAKFVTREHEIANLQKSMQNFDAIAQKSQQLSQQQEKLVTEWQSAQKGDLTQWRIAESAYLVRMANNQLKFVHDNQLALVLLREADALLQSAPGSESIRTALQENIAQLETTPQIDTTALYLRLYALDKQVDSLPLQTLPLTQEKPNFVTNNANRANDAGLPWWKVGFNNAYRALAQLVVVRDTSKTALPLMVPDEKTFLLQNLHAQFANAMWGVLNRKAEVYATSTVRITEWLKQYFNLESQATIAMLNAMDELQKINLAATSSVDLSQTLTLYDAYLTQKPTTSTNG